jgi:hypothetical protein
MTWNEELPPELAGTKTKATAKPSEKSEYRINENEKDGTYWVVVLVAASTGKGTINVAIGEGLSREEAETLAEEDFAKGLENERSRAK